MAVATPTPLTPGASVDITYTHAGVDLVPFSVVKYAGTRLLAAKGGGSKSTASIVLFQGGVPTWKFAAGRGLLGRSPLDRLQAELARHERRGVVVDRLVDGGEDPVAERALQLAADAPLGPLVGVGEQDGVPKGRGLARQDRAPLEESVRAGDAVQVPVVDVFQRR